MTIYGHPIFNIFFGQETTPLTTPKVVFKMIITLKYPLVTYLLSKILGEFYIEVTHVSI